ncbi:TPA: hypothetical protein ACGO4G_001857, partial [Streptococcus suis]
QAFSPSSVSTLDVWKLIELKMNELCSTITNRIEAYLIHFTPLVRNQAGGTCPLAFLKIWYNQNRKLNL